jgi:putative ABC transport system permease protein
MLFLVSVYRGVSDGTLDYIRHNRADLWVMQENATNIVRGSSLLFPKQGKVLEHITGIQSVSPIFLTLSVVKAADQTGTVYLVGYDLQAKWGGPPSIAVGRTVQADSEIVLDDRFAAKMHLAVGDMVQVNQTRLRVAGLSTGTNAAVIQYAFVALKTAQKLFGQVKIISAYLISLEPDADRQQVGATVRRVLREVSVFTHDEFIENNRHEMQSGFLPFIVAVCTISVVVLVSILSLLLSIVVLERRADFAVMKTIGAPSFVLPLLVLDLAAIIAVSGTLVGLVLYSPVTQLVRIISPELCTRTTGWELMTTTASVILACVIAALVPLRKLRSIYPAESFV